LAVVFAIVDLVDTCWIIEYARHLEAHSVLALVGSRLGIAPLEPIVPRDIRSPRSHSSSDAEVVLRSGISHEGDPDHLCEASGWPRTGTRASSTWPVSLSVNTRRCGSAGS